MRQIIILSLASIVILGGLYLYQEKQISPRGTQKEALKRVPNAPSQKNIQTPGGAAPPAAFKEGSEAPFFGINPGLLSSFLRPRLNFLGVLDDEIPAKSDQKSAQSLSPIDKEVAGSIRSYLIASSDLFPKDLYNRFLEALAGFSKGDVSGIETLRDDYRTRLEKLTMLKPPREMERVHQGTVEVIEHQIALLNHIAEGNYKTLEDIANSKENQDLLLRARQVKQELLRLVEAYQIHLPSDVLAY